MQKIETNLSFTWNKASWTSFWYFPSSKFLAYSSKAWPISVLGYRSHFPVKSIPTAAPAAFMRYPTLNKIIRAISYKRTYRTVYWTVYESPWIFGSRRSFLNTINWHVGAQEERFPADTEVKLVATSFHRGLQFSLAHPTPGSHDVWDNIDFDYSFSTHSVELKRKLYSILCLNVPVSII